ncbi:hypothetical protein D9M68_749420 [compost metagenome]
MELEQITVKDINTAPPLLPWRTFADWIGMTDEHAVVEAWIQRGYLPSLRIGRWRCVNVALLVRQLLEQEDI